MSAQTFRRTAMPLIVLLLGCSEEPTGPARSGPPPEDHLSFTFVHVDPDRLVSYEHVVEEAPEGTPLPSGEWWGDEMPSSTRIFNPRTVVHITSYGASAMGRHEYTGNIGRVNTTLHVSFESQHLGTRTGVKQNSTPFLLDGGRIKDIWVFARLYTDKACGLEAHGSSVHSASWGFFDGSGAGSWGQSRASSEGRPDRGAPCGRRIDNEDPTGRYTEGGGVVCTYLITYDLDTLEIVDVQLLSCASRTLF